jgi:nitroimidazol reductase NimA-like FMN-containing flavoprotein (pyridoxamine 5'-phosphate oxidase superfamily)
MNGLTELSPRECVDLIAGGGVGRIAVCTPTGPEIFPVNFVVDGDAVVFRTTPYSILGTYGWGSDVAFEVDHLDMTRKQGWSVVLSGRAEAIDDPEEVAEVRRHGGPEPWAAGPRRLYVRLPWRKITGRRISADWLEGTASPSE